MQFEHKQSGFTLLELMITIVVLVVLVTLAVPSFQGSTRNNCAVSGANSLLSVLTLAKSEAQRRGRTVTVCPSSDGTSCATTSTDWAIGVLAFVDTDTSSTFDTGEELIRAITPLSTCSAITSTYSGRLSFDSLAAPFISKTNRLGAGSFTITPKGQTTVIRKLVVSNPSKLRVCDPNVDTSTC